MTVMWLAIVQDVEPVSFEEGVGKIEWKHAMDEEMAMLQHGS